MFVNETPKPAEYLHTSACLARAIICAVENLRDEDGATDFSFRLAMQDNPLAVADGYLADGIASCVCDDVLDLRASVARRKAARA